MQRWIWGSEEKKAFQTAKESLTSDSVLVHFDPKRKLILACDASLYGIGAILSHKMDDGSSRTLVAAEKSILKLRKKVLQLFLESRASISTSLVDSLPYYLTTNPCISSYSALVIDIGSV